MVKWDIASKLRFFLFWVSFLALGVGLLASLYLVGGSFFFERTAKFSEGMETCFSRLRQSHVLYVSGAKGAAGEHTFFKETESCFSELVLYAEKHLPSSLVRALASINNLVIDIHWFHKDLSRAGEGDFGPVAREKFSRLEGARGGIVERLQGERKRRMGEVEAARMVLLVGWGLGMALLVLQWAMAGKGTERIPPRPPNDDSPAGSTVARPQLRERVLLGEIVSRVLGSLADEIFARGIRVEPDIGEDVRIRSQNESLRKVLEIVLSGALRSLGEGGGLKISQQYWGERVVLSLEPLGGHGLHSLQGGTVSVLVGECGGKMEDSPSGWIRLSFAGEGPGRKRAFKGKKKDILGKLSSMQKDA